MSRDEIKTSDDDHYELMRRSDVTNVKDHKKRAFGSNAPPEVRSHKANRSATKVRGGKADGER